jgi:hypothetical protein
MVLLDRQPKDNFLFLPFQKLGAGIYKNLARRTENGKYNFLSQESFHFKEPSIT